MHTFERREDTKQPFNEINITKIIQMLLEVALLFAFSTCNFTIKRWYSTNAHFAGKNMEIHMVFMFLHNLLPLVLSKTHKLVELLELI